MTLKADMVDDLEFVFDSDEFSTYSTLTTAGPVVTTPVITFHGNVTAVDPFTGDIDVDQGKPHALGKEADFLAAKQGDTLVIDGDTYKINRVIPDGSGLSLIWLYTS